jgi:membrane-associated phospholipid phosphatase
LRRRFAYLAIFFVCAVAYVLLGNAVSHVAPSGIDAAARSVTGELPGLAWVLTESCLWPVLVVLGLCAIVLAIRSRSWRKRALFSVILTVVAWQTSDLLKNIFERHRPDYWIVHHETTFAYSSGHAMFAVIVYWLWAWFVLRSDLPDAVRFTIAPLAFAWGCGVIWSRLALGAHYPSDLAGGMVLGTAMIALGTSIAGSLRPAALSTLHAP